MSTQAVKVITMSLALITVGFGIGTIVSSQDNSTDSASSSQNADSVIDSRTNVSAQTLQQSVSQQAQQRVGVQSNQAAKVSENETSLQPVDTDSEEQIAAEEVDLAIATSDIDRLLTNVMYQSTSGYGISDQTRDSLTRLIASDPLANEQVLQMYLSDPHSSAGETLGLILSEFRDENIEAAALAMINPSNDSKDRLAGLELLQQMGIENNETLAVALQIVGEESDSKLVSAALGTLQHQVVSNSQNQNIRATILPRLGDIDPEVRRSSVIAYSEWVSSADSVTPVIQALDDPSVDVRVGAAYAMSKVTAKSIEMRDALVRKINDADEDWQVREQAWHALELHDMDETSYQSYIDFKALRDSYGEAVQ